MKLFLISSFCLTLLAFTCHRAHAQVSDVITVRGKIIDRNDKLPIIGASVIEQDKEKRTVRGVITDINGNFAIKMGDPKNQLVVSFIGYRTYSSGPINGRTTIDVSMVLSSSELNAVAITARRTVNSGTGLNIDARNSTIASVTIDAKDLEELAAASIDQALQGRLPGVDFGTTSGDPGAGMAIRIRGTSSINGSSEPLIVLDGMPYETEIPEDFDFGNADEDGYAQLLNISPADIKDITVLKDAAATAVWGSKAANGVLLINTKRGAIGKPVVTYNFKGSLANQPKAIPMLSGKEYSSLIPEAIMNATGTPLDFLGNGGQNKAFQQDPSDPYYYYNYNNNTNWIDLITQTGYTQDHNVSMSGGGEKARYYASVGYLGQSGTTLGTNLNRITTKINLDYNVSDRLRFRTDLTYTHVSNDQPYTSNLRTVAYNKMPNMAVYEFDEFGNQTSNYFSPESNIQGFAQIKSSKLSGTFNPLAVANEAQNNLTGERITPKFNIQYDIIPSVLLTTADVQFDINNTKTKTFLPQIATGRPSSEPIVNRATDSDGDAYNIATKFNVLYTPRINENHLLQTLLSVQTSDSKNSSYSAITSNSASSELQDPSNESVVDASGSKLNSSQSQSRSVGVLLQGQYTLFDRYIINVNGRLDGNSRLDKSNRFGFFPGISSRWRISGEPFMNDLHFIDDFSLRLSYGATGKAPSSNYQFFSSYDPFGWSYADKVGVQQSSMALKNLTWETLIGKNLGFNLWMFGNRVKVDVEVYQNTTKDMFYEDLNIPTTSGYNKVDMNIGTMENNGWEVGINTVPVKTKNMLLSVDFNISRNSNRITSVSEFYPRESVVGIPALGDYKSYLIPGNPFGSYYGFRYKGVYKDLDATIAKDGNGKDIIGPNGQTVYMRYNYPNIDYVFQPGDAVYEDVNHDGNIDQMDMVYLGNGLPKFSGGFGTSATYKRAWSLRLFFSYRWKYDIVNKNRMTTSNMYGVDNQSTAVLNRWRNPGDVTDMPRALYKDGYNWLGSDRYVEDASFIRLSSVTLRYNMQKGLMKSLNVKNASVYITGQNLYTWTKYTGQNPDVSMIGKSDPFKYPQDNSLTPPAMTFTLGITAGF